MDYIFANQYPCPEFPDNKWIDHKGKIGFEYFPEYNLVKSHFLCLPQVFAEFKEQSFNLLTESGDLGLVIIDNFLCIGSLSELVFLCPVNQIPKNIIKWYSTNLNLEIGRSGRITECLPLGIPDSSYQYIKHKIPKTDKEKLLLVNFRKSSNFGLRNQLYSHYQNQPWATLFTHGIDLGLDSQKTPYKQYELSYFNQIDNHKFVLSPFGNGYDCYRIWEALYLDSIPIIQECPFSNYFKDLPVLIVPDLFSLTPEFLEQKYIEIQDNKNNNKYNMDKLTYTYWKHKIYAKD